MAEMTLDQQKALAMASARLRLQKSGDLSEIPQPRRNYALTEVPGQALDNVGPSAKKFYGGLIDAVTSPIETTKSLLQLVGGGVFATLPEKAQDWLIENANDPQKVRQSIEMARAMGGMYKDRYGSYEGIKRTFAEDPVGAAADLSTLLSPLLSGAGAVATKAGMTKTGAVLSKTGAVINPMLPVGVAANVVKYPLTGANQLIQAAFNPKNALYLRAAEGRGQEIINALRNAQEIVPGSVPTAAQAAADTGVVGFQKLGKSSAAELETAYKTRQSQQATAQLQAVRGVGKTPEDIARAEIQRKAKTQPLYDQADRTLSEVDSQFLNLTNRPSMTQVLTRARRLAAEKNIPFEIGETKASSVQPSTILDAQGRPVGTVTTPASFAQLPGTSVHFIKQAFDDMIKDPSTFGIGASEANAIKRTRAEFLKWVEQTNKNPAYGQARELFTKESKPINQMEVGQYLESKLVPALGEETARLRATGYATALEQAPGTIKKATGESRFKTLEEVFADDPQSLKALHSVRDDLARQAKSEALMKGPVKREFDVSKSTEALAGENALPNMINRVTTIANDVWRRLRGKIDQQTAVEIATEMLFPGKAADALEKAIRNKARKDAITAAVSAPVKAAYATPAMINMLGTSQENQNALAR